LVLVTTESTTKAIKSDRMCVTLICERKLWLSW